MFPFVVVVCRVMVYTQQLLSLFVAKCRTEKSPPSIPLAPVHSLSLELKPAHTSAPGVLVLAMAFGPNSVAGWSLFDPDFSDVALMLPLVLILICTGLGSRS